MINTKGYSIIELLVGLAIIGLIFSLSLSFYKNNSTKNFVGEDAYLLKTNMLKAKNMAISGQSNVKYSENNSYGIYFRLSHNGEYLIYKDSDSNNKYSSSEVTETIKIDNSIISSLYSGSTMDLLFQSNGDIYLNEVKVSSGNFNINLFSKGVTKSILINALTNTITIQ